MQDSEMAKWRCWIAIFFSPQTNASFSIDDNQMPALFAVTDPLQSRTATAQRCRREGHTISPRVCGENGDQNPRPGR